MTRTTSGQLTQDVTMTSHDDVTMTSREIYQQQQVAVNVDSGNNVNRIMTGISNNHDNIHGRQ